MTGQLSAGILQRVEVAQQADLAVEQATIDELKLRLLEKMHDLPCSFDVLVGVGSVGCQLANSMAQAVTRQGNKLDWKLAPLDEYGMARLRGSIERGRTLIVSAVPVPGEELSWAVNDTRADHAIVSDMLVVKGYDQGHDYMNAARQLGLAVHSLVSNE